MASVQSSKDHMKRNQLQKLDRLLHNQTQDNSILASPLSFRNPSQALIPGNPVGRPLVQHLHPTYSETTPTRRQTISNFDRLRSHHYGDTDYRSNSFIDRNSSCSSDSEQSEVPTLWSMYEECSPEPMDISPDKPLSFPSRSQFDTTYQRQSLLLDTSDLDLTNKVSNTQQKCVQVGDNSKKATEANDEQPFQSHAWIKPEVIKSEVIKPKVHHKKSYSDKKIVQNKCSSIDQKSVQVEDNSKKVTEASTDKSVQSRGWISWCCIMILQLFAGAGIVVASMFGVDMFSFWCKHYRDFNTTSLSHTLNKHVFGQHIAVETIPIAITEYLHQTTIEPRQPLVLSFHGWTGIGKNHVSFLIKEHLRKGHGHKIISTLHFPHANVDYSKMLEEMIIPKLSKCELNLFLIDEIDKAPDSVIRSFLNILNRMRSREFLVYDYRVVFLLLSNTGANQINRHVFETIHMRSDLREVISHEALVNKLLEAQSENVNDFSWFTKLYNEGLIDVIIPFLPLERRHVEKCAEADMRSKGLYPSTDMIKKVLGEMSFVPEETPIFSASGCRRVPSKVDVTGL